jgi:hypothetical protein
MMPVKNHLALEQIEEYLKSGCKIQGDRLKAICDRLKQQGEAAKDKQTELLTALMSQV